MLQRPNESEYPAYYQPYIQLVPKGELLHILKADLEETVTLFEGISEENSYFRYDENKWSIKEVLCHMADTERIMSYRLLRVGRGDATELAGFNENDYVKGSQIERLLLKNILDDFVATRNATISLIQNIPETAWENNGFANNMPITTRAIAYIIAGHAIHHKKIITERYLATLK